MSLCPPFLGRSPARHGLTLRRRAATITPREFDIEKHRIH